MTAIRVASLIHFLWGLYLVIFPHRVPHPFGAFDPFYSLVTPFELGLIFLLVAALAISKNFVRADLAPWFMRPLLIVPQQMVLMYGLLGNFWNIFGNELVDRNFLALCYMLSITIFHTLDVIEYWHDHFLRRVIDKHDGGKEE